MKHTKGPWKYIGWDGQMEIRTEDNKELGIAFLGNREDGAIPNGKTRANAHLIAAAPELLEACKLAIEAIHQRLSVDGGKIGAFKTEIKAVLSLKKAINKAEGV